MYVHKSRHAQHRNFTWRCACGCVFSKAIRIDVVISRGHVIHAIIVLLACRGDSKPADNASMKTLIKLKRRSYYLLHDKLAVSLLSAILSFVGDSVGHVIQNAALPIPFLRNTKAPSLRPWKRICQKMRASDVRQSRRGGHRIWLFFSLSSLESLFSDPLCRRWRRSTNPPPLRLQQTEARCGDRRDFDSLPVFALLAFVFRKFDNP